MVVLVALAAVVLVALAYLYKDLAVVNCNHKRQWQ
jgi:hypothetical protein